jgi:acetolactate synthase-1/2/3 large subunit
MRVDQAIAEILKLEGVTALIAYPVNPVIEAAAAAGIRTVIVRQERTGIHMADAVSRVTSGERIGVFAMQHGPGVENSFGAIAQAYAESVPILLLPGGYPRRLTSVRPNFSAFLNLQHVTKWNEQLLSAAEAGAALRRAFTQARNGRPRPALIELPVDVLNEELPQPLAYRPALRTRTQPDGQAIDQAARVLVAAARPVIYAGQGVHYAQGWDALRRLAELLEAPVTTSLEGKSAFPEDHPLSLGSGGRSLPGPVHEFLGGADVILGVGCSFSTTTYGVSMPPGRTIIHATVDPADLSKDVEAAYALIGDARLTLEALYEAVRERVGGGGRGRTAEVAGRIAASRERWLKDWMPKLTSDEVPLSPYRVIWDLLHTVDVADTIITHDAGSPRDQLSPFWRARSPLSYLGWGKTTQLGYGLGLAMGAKLARPEKLCINVWGDAAIGFTGMDFETAVRERLPILSLLLNNHSMACELGIMRAATERFRSTDISGDYAAFACALGGHGERVTHPDEIVGAIRRGIEKTRQGTPVLLEFMTAQETAISTFPRL